MGNTLEKLEGIIEERKKASPDESYTSKLINSGIDKILKKIGEEATELIISATKQAKEQIIYETADLLYHLLVMLNYNNIRLEEIYSELEKRTKISGIEEKRRRKND